MTRLSKSVIGNDEIDAVTKVLKKEYLGMGEEVKSFENDLSHFFSRDAICTNTGTSAIHLALQALGVGCGDEVLVQSLTFVATFQAITATGAKPISCDINLHDLTIDLDDARKKVNSRTKVIIPVHYAGCPGDLSAIYNFALINNLRVVEDASHAFGSVYENRKIGSFGDIACFSFDGIKNITSGEGGAVVCDDQRIKKKIADTRLLGVINDTEMRFQGKRSWEFDVIEQGWRYHMSNIMAAIGRVQLRRFPEFKEKRQGYAKKYVELLSNNNNINLLAHDYNLIVPHIFVIHSSLKDKIKLNLERNDVQTGLHYKPNHLLTFYKSYINLQNTEYLYNRLITLPLHPDLSYENIEQICQIINETSV